MAIAFIAGCDFLSLRSAAASQESARRNAYAVFMALNLANWDVRELYNGALLRQSSIVVKHISHSRQKRVSHPG
jgi:hypothetical protein